MNASIRPVLRGHPKGAIDALRAFWSRVSQARSGDGDGEGHVASKRLEHDEAGLRGWCDFAYSSPAVNPLDIHPCAVLGELVDLEGLRRQAESSCRRGNQCGTARSGLRTTE